MARSKKRREQHRTAVTGLGDRPAPLLVIPLESIEWTSKTAVRRQDLTRWFRPLGPDRLGDLERAGPSVSIVLDRFALTLFATVDDDGIEWTGTHEGPDFHDAAVEAGSIDVYVTSDADARRMSADELTAAAASGSLIGARVSAFSVQTL